MSTVQPVSFDSEPLILVDQEDRAIGYMPKSQCHRGHGTLHRAFSVFLFNARGELLLQQRSESKPLWPLYWSNSCCSHPRRGESIEQASLRRVLEELGVECHLTWLYKFIYQADYLEVGAEHEFCHVLIGRCTGDVVVHPDEIAAWRWLSMEQLNQDLNERPDRFTPWFKLEWARLQQDWMAEIQALQHRRKSA
ncbi:MAG: isopentenyl-diphosphate Delta-isomerase [Pseudomonadota bacterium]